MEHLLLIIFGFGFGFVAGWILFCKFFCEEKCNESFAEPENAETGPYEHEGKNCKVCSQ